MYFPPYLVGLKISYFADPRSASLHHRTACASAFFGCTYRLNRCEGSRSCWGGMQKALIRTGQVSKGCGVPLDRKKGTTYPRRPERAARQHREWVRGSEGISRGRGSQQKNKNVGGGTDGRKGSSSASAVLLCRFLFGDGGIKRSASAGVIMSSTVLCHQWYYVIRFCQSSVVPCCLVALVPQFYIASPSSSSSSPSSFHPPIFFQPPPRPIPLSCFLMPLPLYVDGNASPIHQVMHRWPRLLILTYTCWSFSCDARASVSSFESGSQIPSI